MKLLLWPFQMLWFFIGFLFSLMGRLLTAIVGITLAIIGAVLTLTIVASFIGIPLIAFGILLMIRAVF